jgi:phosphate transport system protein
MTTHLQTQVEELKLKLLKMAALAGRSIDQVFTAYLKRDAELAFKVIEGDKEIDALECDIDDRCLKMLALEQPVALDLRYIVAGMRMVIDLERVGDEASNIAVHTVSLAQMPLTPPHPMMDELTVITRNMYEKAVESFRDRNLGLAEEVCAMDELADELNMRILHDCIETMACEKKSVHRAMHRIMISKAMERICDLSTNIAESSIFIVRGVSAKHGSLKNR